MPRDHTACPFRLVCQSRDRRQVLSTRTSLSVKQFTVIYFTTIYVIDDSSDDVRRV